MKTKKKQILFEKVITSILLLFIAIEIIAECLQYNLSFIPYRPVVGSLILGLYLLKTEKRNNLFLIVFILLILTSIFILSSYMPSLIFGLVGIIIHRILIMYYIIKLNMVKDFVPILIAIVPFIFLFSYLLSVADEIPKHSYYPLVVQNILVSMLAGLILSNHYMNQNSNTAWLSIFGLLSTALYFTVFIEKCFLSNLPPTYFNPLGMLLFATSYFSFYKFVIHAEQSKTNLDNLKIQELNTIQSLKKINYS
ncbi:hypothetical protein SAMN05444396_105267 [Flavobacterium segetis]|uniref:YhhN-like protein n=1 Tax=Flavobacterium segetis TaxID=271157 RepID=A0A1M5HRE4_9FLAO|nr:hypothetical protein [Flavobacterium segetis]SHG18495.1 hypothetical protein SAMN05444396_105267 [Flavobacterium segetis]